MSLNNINCHPLQAPTNPTATHLQQHHEPQHPSHLHLGCIGGGPSACSLHLNCRIEASRELERDLTSCPLPCPSCPASSALHPAPSVSTVWASMGALCCTSSLSQASKRPERVYVAHRSPTDACMPCPALPRPALPALPALIYSALHLIRSIPHSLTPPSTHLPHSKPQSRPL